MEIVFWVIQAIVALVIACVCALSVAKRRRYPSDSLPRARSWKSMGSICRREENFMTTLPERSVPRPLDAQSAFAVTSDKGATRELPRSMSALPPKADMCSATRDVRFVPIADIALFHWITSSAPAISERGTVRPSALAVLRLMTSSNLVVRSIGRSAGLSPLRIRPV